jgi:hypothetical protein
LTVSTPQPSSPLNRHGVDYVVIGGFAAELHAAPVEPTRDIDFTPATTMANLARVSAALDELGACIRTATEPGGLAFSHDAASLGHARVWNLTRSHGEFDLSFVPSGTEGYDDLVRQALRVAVPGGGHMAVASFADVIRSKRAAGRQKDLRALPALQRRLTAQVRQSPARQARELAQRAADRLGGHGPARSSNTEATRRLATEAGRRSRRGPETGFGR